MTSFFMMTGFLVSQNLFAKTYGGTGEDCAYSMTRTTDGGLAVAGSTKSYGAGNTDFLILKISSTGTPEWARTFGGTGTDACFSLIQTTDGGYALAGDTRSFGAGGIDLLVLKLSSAGNPEWAKSFGGTDDDLVRSIIQTADGGFAVTGYTYSFGAGNDDFLIIKLSSSGNVEWARTLGGTLYDDAFSVIQTMDGGYAVAGSTVNFGAGGWDFLILKLSSAGNLQWARTFGGPNGDFLASPVIQTPDSGFMLAGHTESFGAGDWDCLVLKLSSTGTLEWAKTFGGTNTDNVRSVVRTADGGYAIAGWSRSFGDGSIDFLVLKISSNGNLEWARSFGDTGWDDPFSMTQASDNGYAIAGWTDSFGAGSGDFLVLKIGPDGNYADCVNACSPTVMSVSPATTSPGAGLIACSPTVTSPSPTTGTPGLTITDVCESQYVDEIAGKQPGLTCSPLPGGALFVSPTEMPLRIYSADGRIAYSGELEKGQNRISLETGVYLWRAGSYKGKVTVR